MRHGKGLSRARRAKENLVRLAVGGDSSIGMLAA